MHGTFERRGNGIRRADPNWSRNIAVLALPTLMAIAMIGLALTQPAASRWIAEAAQAEFTGPVSVPDAVPTELAQQAGAIRTARTN
jgi:hypothetical protein